MPLIYQEKDPRRLSDLSPSLEQSIYREEIERRAGLETIRSEGLGKSVLKETPQKETVSTWKQDIYKEEIERRRATAPPAVKERGVIGELAAGFGRGALGVIAAPAEIADIAGEAIGWEALEKAGESGAKAIEKYIKESPKLKRTESISKNILKNPELWKDPRWYSSIVGEGLPTILSMFIPGMAAAKAAKVAKLGAKGVRAARIAGGLTAGVGLEAAGAASDVRQYEEQTGAAIPISTKLQTVLGTGIVAGSLEYVPIFAMFGKAGASKLVSRVLTGMATEGTTEGAQELVANAFAKAGYDADQNMVDGVVESIVGGVLLGGGMGAVSRATNFKERVDETNPEEVSEILEQTETEAKIPEEQQAEFTRRREETALRTAEERQAAIEAAAPMTTASDETTTLAEEVPRPEPIVEEIVPEEVVPEELPLVPGEIPAPLRAMGMRPAPAKPAVAKAAVPFMVTKETEAGLSKLGYTKDDIAKMSPEDALGIVEAKITKEPVVPEKIEPEVEIPELTDTTQAIEFGKKATPEQITELKRLRKESEARYDVLIKEDKLDEAGKEALRAQLYREAFESKEKPKEPVVEKAEVAAKEPWEMTKAEYEKTGYTETMGDYDFQIRSALDAGKITDAEYNKLTGAKELWEISSDEFIYETRDKPKIERQKEFLGKEVISTLEKSHKTIIKQAISEGKPVPKEVLAEYPDLVPAKPITEKPPKDIYAAMIREEDAKVTAEISDAVKAEREYARIDRLQVEFKETAAKKGYSAQAQDIIFGDIDQLLFDIDKGRINKEAAVSMYEDAVAKKIAIPEKLDKFKQRLLKPAKPQAPKPPKPKPPEAVREEIEVEPIPEVGKVSPKLVEKQKTLEKKIERLKNRIDQAEKTAMPGTFVTGRENVPRSRIRKLEAQLDKRIDSAVEYEKLKKELTQIESQIKSQEEAPQKKRIEEKVKIKLKEQFDTIKVGDQIDVGGNNILTVTKKNPKSVLTEAGGKWTADEIISVIPKVAPKVEKKPEPGFAWIKGKQKPILSAREITKGKNKGKYEVTLTKGRDAEGNIIPGAKKIVTEKEIITMPGKILEVAPIEKAKVIKPVIPGVKPKVKKEKIEVVPEYKIEKYEGVQVGYGKPGRRGAMDRTRKVKGYKVTEPDGYERVFDTKKEAESWVKEQAIEVTPISEAKSRIKASTTEILKGERGSFSTETKEGAATFEDFSIVGKDFIKRGADSFVKFTEQMKKTFGEVWESVKHLAKEIYESAKRALRNERGLIGGIEAVGAPTGVLSKAKDMLAVGKTKKEVWEKTGWLKGVEEKYRFEIDDSKAAVDYVVEEDNKAFALQVRLGEILIHSELFKAYPDLKNLIVSLRVEAGLETSGRFVFERFQYPERAGSRSAIEIETSTKPKMKEALLHELQHAIQRIEGFAGGASPYRLSSVETRWFFDGKPEDEFSWALAREIQKESKKVKVSVPGQKREIRFSKEKTLELKDRWGKLVLSIGKKVLKLKRKSTIEQEKRRLKMFKDALGEISRKSAWIVRTENSIFDRYLRTAGEIEARDVATRAKLTPEQRREQIPYEAEGIPEDQWIITKGEGTSFSVEGIKAPVVKEVKKLTPAEKAAKAFKVLGIKPKLKPEEPLPKRARSVGLAYQDISEEAKRLEVEMGLEYPKVTRTHAELREQADRIMGDQEQLIKTMEKEKNFTEAEGLVVRRAAATGLESLMKVVATKDIKKANEIHKKFKEGAGKQIQDLHSEFGRNLESLKEKVSPESMSKAFASLERDLNKDDMDMFNSAAEALGQGNAKPMINFQKYLKTTKQDPKIMDYVYEYWYNSILSGVPTHVVNVASNTAWGAWQVGVHKPLLAAIDPLIAKFQKRPTEYYMAEVIPALAGIKRGLKPGIKGAKEVIVKGYTTDAELDKFAADMGSSVGAFARSPNKHLRTIAPFLTMPTRALRAMDIWAKQMNYEAELGSVAKRMEKQGKGKYEELLKNPTQDMMNQAAEYADYTTFMGKLGKIGTTVESLRTAVPGGRFIVPFVRTIANLVKRGVEMTPGVGAMKLLGGKVKGKEVTQVLAKQIEGAMIALVVASMFDDDELTGDVPANKAEREAFYRQGKKPWSALMGDRWYQYRRIEPFNTPIAAVAILYDTWKRTGEEPSTEFAYRSAAGFVNNIIDSSYLSGLTQVLDSVRKADKWPQKLTNMFDKTLASFSPMSSFQRSFVRAIEAIDKEGAILRKPKGAVETVAAATPFLSEMVPARKDVWGKEIMVAGTPLEQWLPWKTAKETDDVVEIEIERLHGAGLMSYPGMPAKYMSIGGKRLDLDDEQYDALITESGQASKKKLDSLVGTKYWGMLSDKEKASRIQKIIKDNRKRARNKIKKEFKVAIPGMVPWKKTKKKKRPAWQETAFGKIAGWQKPMEF